MNSVWTETCVYCGRELPIDEMRHEFTLDTHFTAESSEWSCRDDAACRAAEIERDKRIEELELMYREAGAA